MEEGLTWLQEFGLACLFDGPDLRVSAASSGAQEAEKDLWFSQKFGGTKIWVKVPANVVCEVSGAVLSQKDVMAGMKLELEELDALSVATIIDEVTARKTATRRIHTTRWVITSKPSKENPNRVRARLVVRDYALGSSPLSEGIYSPTTSLEALRSVLAIHAAKGGTLLSADVSVAFMQAPVQGVEVIRFPAGMSDNRGKPLFARLHKAMKGLRVGPLSWYLEFTAPLKEQGFGETADATVHRYYDPKTGLILVLCYVDDLLIYSENPSQAEEILKTLARMEKMKKTGVLKPRETGTLEFLGRVIVRAVYGGPVVFGLKPGYLSSLGEEFQIGAGKSRNLPNLERLYKSQKETAPISREAYERYRRILGKLMWASLTLPHLQYSVGFLGRFQQGPDNRAENCLRAVVRWVTGLPEYMQEFYPTSGTSEKILSGFVDASWNVTPVSGTILCWKGMMLKCFSRKRATTALSSAEAELVALVEAAKEEVYVGLLMESLLEGLQPQQETGSYRLVFYSDSEAAISISAMSGLLRRVRHLELRARFLQELVNSGRLKLEFIARS